MRRRRNDSGFALLLVFLMAAIAAIMLYEEVPRVAFQTQRQKEQLLVERGEQYRRAIQLFLRASNNQRWPASIDELESFNGRRFLRHRYKDPMTGKEEWRLVHIQNGVLTDSVNNKLPGKPGDQGKDTVVGDVGDYGSSVGSYNASQQGPGGLLNAAQRRRASDNAAAQGSSPFPVAGGNPPDGSGQTAGMPVPGQNQPGAPLPGQPLPGVPGVPGMPGRVPGQANNSNGNSQSGYSSIGDYGSLGSSPTPSQPSGSPVQYPPGMQGQPGNSQFGGNGGLQNAGSPGMSVNPAGGAGQSGAAAQLIGNILTTPRPGGISGTNPGANTTIGGGIAGVASTADGDSIMVYNDRTNYSEWEFIFDPSKQKYPPPNPVSGAAIGTPAAALGSMPGGSVGTPAAQLGTAPGAAAGTQGVLGAAGNPGMPGMAGTPGMAGAPAAGSPFGGASSPPDIRPGRK